MSTKADAAKKAAEKDAQTWAAPMANEGPIPVTILTGFFGRGQNHAFKSHPERKSRRKDRGD